MKKHLIRVGVLRGGTSDEYPVSIKTGETVLRVLDRSQYEPVDIFIDRDGLWHVNGFPVKPYEALKGIDIAWNALHGHFGEDGKIQAMLERFGIPYNGADSFSSTLGMNKHITRQLLRDAGVVSPRYYLIRQNEPYEKIAVEIWRTFPQPSIVKPASNGSSLGIVYANEYHDFLGAIRDIIRRGDDCLVEEYIRGKELSVPVVESFRGESHYVPLPTHILKNLPVYSPFSPREAHFFRPATYLSDEEKETVRRTARIIHDRLSLRHYSTIDFILSPKNLYFLEVNTLPALYPSSTTNFSLSSVGVQMSEFVGHVLGLTLQNR